MHSVKAVAAIAALGVTAHAGTTRLLRRDPPAALSGCATDADQSFQPALDFDTDGCYNTAAIGSDGTLNEGLDNCYTTGEAECRDESDLDNQNVYSRARCNNGWCAYLYGYYFEKDVALERVCGVGAGHRHDWEHVVVWTQDGNVMYVGASAHGNYDVRPASDVIFQDSTHPFIVYHKDGASTHAFRFGSDADFGGIENHKGVPWIGSLIGWFGFPDGATRDTMANNDWGSATIDFTDGRFAEVLESAKGGNDIPMDTSVDDENSPGQPQC